MRIRLVLQDRHRTACRRGAQRIRQTPKKDNPSCEGDPCGEQLAPFPMESDSNRFLAFDQ